MFSHVMIGANNLQESIEFYDRVMPLIGCTRRSTGDTFAGYSDNEDLNSNSLWVGVPFNGELATAGNGVNVGLLAGSRDQVDEFYKSAIEAGAKDEGAPGVREDAHPNFYAAYVRDPTGNKLVVVCHKPNG